MRVLVCGGRDFKDYPFLCRTLGVVDSKEGIDTIISGAAKGADTLAADWAAMNWAYLEEYPAQWDKYGRKAGPIRNKQMLDEGQPDLVIAFPGGHGTDNMCKQAEKAGVEVRRV